MVVLDTCAIIEACKTAPSFSEKIYQHIEKEAAILSISFAEIACKIKLGKLEMGVSPHALFLEMSRVENIHMIDIGAREWFNAIALDWEDNRDPADRVITAWAIDQEVAIVTNDQKIKAFYPKVIW